MAEQSGLLRTLRFASSNCVLHPFFAEQTIGLTRSNGEAVGIAAPSLLRFVELRSSSLVPAAPDSLLSCAQMAEKEGFEPPVPFLAQQISRLPHSATLALLQSRRLENEFCCAWLQVWSWFRTVN